MKRVIAVLMVLLVLVPMNMTFAEDRAVPSQIFATSGKRLNYWIDSYRNIDECIMNFFSEVIINDAFTYEMIDIIKYAMNRDYTYVGYA